jgi:hypothetical protein
VSIVVVIVDVVVNVGNVMDFHGYPSNLHKCPHLFMDVPQPLVSWYYVFF